MSENYEVLAQKWRPQIFGDVVGQKHVITTLKNQIRSNRIGHAYIFWGPRGTGKTTTARIFAKAVNCRNSHDDVEPCNSCQICDEISIGRSFDVIEMDAASNRGIDPIRELRENTKLAPVSSKYKIYIIDEAHMLTTEAFNALLKTLEEPPSHVIFILATTEHHKIPRTIISRCQDFDFRYMEQDLVIDRLREICTAEQISIDNEGLAVISHQSEGCMRDAQNLLERLTASIGHEIEADGINEILGLTSASILQDLSRAILECETATALGLLDQLTQQGTDLMQCLNQLISYFSDLRRLAIDPKLADQMYQYTFGNRSPAEIDDLRQNLEHASIKRISRIVKIFIHTGSEIKRHGFAKIQLESAFIDVCQIRTGLKLTDLLKRLREIEDKIDKGDFGKKSSIDDRPISGVPSTEATIETVLSPRSPQRETTPQPQISAEAPEFSIELEEDRRKAWTKTIKTLRDQRSPVHHDLAGSSILSINSDRNRQLIEVGCVRPQMVNRADRQKIMQILKTLFGRAVELKIVRIDAEPRESPRRPTASETSEPRNRRPSRHDDQQTITMRSLVRQAENDPQISPILQQFDAKIIAIDQVTE